MINLICIQAPLCNNQYHSRYYTIMFTKLTTSTTVGFTDFIKNQYDSEANTSQTLSALPQDCSETDQLYFSPDASFQQLLSHTLSHGRLDSLQDKLHAVMDSGRAVMQTETNSVKITNYEQNLENISEKLQSSLIKIAEQRQLIRQKLIKMFLLQAKRTQCKNIRKANLLKYRDLLLTIKQLYDKNFKSQQQVINLRQRLRTSGLFLVPTLIEHAVVALVKEVISDQARRVQLKDYQHLQMAVNYFMNNADLSQSRLQSASSEHPLYQKLKMYIRLKKYIIVPQDCKDLDNLCQNHIRDYYWKNISSITATEHIKVRSLVQSCESARAFLKLQSAEHIKFALVKSVGMLNKVTDHTEILIYNFVEPILKKNKKNSSKQSVVSSQTIRFLDESEQISVEQICLTLQVIDQRSSLISLHQKQFGLQFEAVQIKRLVIIEAIKCLLIPILRVLIGLNNIYYQTKERNYQNSRLVYKRILTWSSLFGENQQIETDKLMHKIKQSIDLLTFNQKSSEPKKNAVKTNKNNKIIQKDSLNSTIAEAFIQYHNNYGQTYMYLAGKYQQLNLEQLKLSSQNKFEPLSFTSLMAVWTQLISSQIVNHLICQFQPVNILKNIEFRQDDMLEQIDNQHKMENMLTEIHSKIQSSPTKKSSSKSKISEEIKEELYPMVLELNLRTRNHSTLMEICKAIGVYDLMKSQNNTVYEELFKKKFFNFI